MTQKTLSTLANGAHHYRADEAAATRFWDDLPEVDRDALQPMQPVLMAAASASPHLAKLAARHNAYLVGNLSRTPQELMVQLCKETAGLSKSTSKSEVAIGLRLLKQKAALIIGLADLACAWPVMKVTTELTHFADACLNAGLNFLLREAAEKQRLVLQDAANPSLNCGYFVLAMGKHGAFELNYSSDIDLIVLYDPEVAPLATNVEPSTFFVRLTRDLVALLQDITDEGYVFRVDLRLRPDPRATQVAISLEAAAVYYENQGQNWERAAMIKARVAAGDICLGDDFLKRLTPYIWRKYLDYAAIADVQSLKRQIHAVKGHSEIAVRGHNLKLGRGGIREIEFFVQTQQLIAGGRNPKLRGRATLDMLHMLAEAKWIEPQTAQDLESAYKFLRMLEHRVQMVDDQQSHIVPSESQAFENYARFAGFENGDALALKLRATLETVQAHYAALFEDAEALAAEGGSLVFTGGEDDPGTIETLQRMGFALASEVSATIRGWHFGRYAATRTARAREILTEIMPALLKALSQRGDPDQAFLAFDQFLGGLPSGVQLFSMLKANPNLLELIAQILGQAPRMADQLKRQPRTLEAVAGADAFRPLATPQELAAEFALIIPADARRDEAMDAVRVLVREHQFRVGLRLLSETISAEEAGQGYSAIADQAITTLLAATVAEMCASHGEVPGGQCAVVAMGKLGGREMTAGSDLDLMLIYDHAANAELSDGEKPLSPNQYYARLTQRLMSALSAPTAEGTLFEVDLRLRPSGSKGPVAVSYASFESYQDQEAWTWEKMALTRARVVAGSQALSASLARSIAKTLVEPRDTEKTKADVRDMRKLMLAEHAKLGLWDLKRAPGGLVEVEFIAQYLQLVGGDATVLSSNTVQALQQLGQKSVLTPEIADTLIKACHLYLRLTQILRLCVAEQYDPEKSNKALNEAVARAAEAPTLAAAEALLVDTQAEVAAIFTRLIGRG
ncbi:MAG: bifunctional [glutamine synthetase] adenylyltransferase/[glutamine synthetase]-adenylyl-L-tyrosine phosphorylase [Alphaproteobacteria bacterium]|nr:bifunctional [glutamine synthetase] adenylyltransferase/[glutamine synthetase]-adenylyl-L-tyrosine phosphorylase [Alphaproteobacteria bacterium]